MDEFSDFQMAVQMPTSSAVSMGTPPPLFSKHHMTSQPSSGKSFSKPGIRFSSDSSPVHSIASHTAKSDLVHSQIAATQSVGSSCPPAVNKFGATVGSRLANYDLGFSGPQTQTNGFQNNLDFPLTASSASFVKTINNSSNQPQLQPSLTTQRNNQDLLIGEEDKYSALRMLIETDINSSSSVFEKPSASAVATQNMSTETVNSFKNVQSTSNVSCNGTANINSSVSSSTLLDLNVSNSANTMVVNSVNLTGALKFSSENTTVEPIPQFKESCNSVGDSTDFGDFQSFTGYTSSSTTPKITESSVTNNVYNAGFESQQVSTDFHKAPYHTAFQKQTSFDFFEPEITVATVSNGNCKGDDGDTEFGDFVSVEPVISENQQNKLPPVPAPAPLPLVSQWKKHIDLSPLTFVQQTPPPLPSALQEDKENIENIMDIGGYFSKYSTFEHESSHSLTKPEQRTAVQVNSDVDDEFDTFATVTSTVYSNVVSNNTSDQDKILDCTITKTNQANVSTPSLSSATFIRTSLIRNDKVTDIDPVKWNQSVEESNNDLDYNSFEKKDSSGVGKSKFLDVSPETRSIASLDLGNYVTVDYSETNSVNNNTNLTNNNNNSFYSSALPSQNQHQHNNNGFKSGSSLTSGVISLQKGVLPGDDQGVYEEYDKYQCFREETESEHERYHFEWSRCLAACKEMISKAFAVFNGASTSEVLREVVNDDKGYAYVMNILEVYRISRRIRNSAIRLGVQSKLESVSTEIANFWESLSAFLLGTCVSTEISQENLDNDDCCIDDPSIPEDLHPACGVCLCTVNTSESCQFLDYGGKLYHCKCANFWVNEVDAILPSLSYVSCVVANSNNSCATAVSSCHGNGNSQSKYNRANSLV